MGHPSPPLLTQAQREQFTRFPPPGERTLSRYSLLSGDDLHLIRERRRDFNKLGYAVQLTVLRHLGRALRPGETPPEKVLAYLAQQLRVDPACYAQYAARDPTRHEHFAALCHRFGYVELSRRLNHELRDWLMPLAVVTDQPFPLMSTLMDELRRRKVLVPRFSVLERLVQSARVRAQGYGYQFWRCRFGAYRADGAFGQFCVVMPRERAVLAITANAPKMQRVLDHVWAHLLAGMAGRDGRGSPRP